MATARRLETPAESLESRVNAAVERLETSYDQTVIFRDVETVARAARRMARSGVPAKLVALLNVAIDDIRETSEYLDSSHAFQRIREAEWARRNEGLEERNEIMRLGREALARRKREALDGAENDRPGRPRRSIAETLESFDRD